MQAWILLVITLGRFFTGCARAPLASRADLAPLDPREVHLVNPRILPAELAGNSGPSASSSWDGSQLVFVSQTNCGQMISIHADGTEAITLSDGKNAANRPRFLPGDERVVFTRSQCPSTLEDGASELWTVKRDGLDPLPFEPGAPHAYNAQAAACKDGKVVFTSDREGDFELYVGKLDRFSTLTEIKRITRISGYDGDAAFSPDCRRIVWRSNRSTDRKEKTRYKSLLKKHLPWDGPTEIWTANADGSDARQVTRLGIVSQSPIFSPDSAKIIFVANPHDAKMELHRKSDLYEIRADGTGLEQITFSDSSDMEPFFTQEGKSLLWVSDRASKPRGGFKVMKADWKD